MVCFQSHNDGDMMQQLPLELENQVDKGYIRMLAYGDIILMVLGALLGLYYWSIVPVAVTILTITAIWGLVWIRQYYMNPGSVTIGELGITLNFRYGRGRKFIPWDEIDGLWISDNHNTVAQAVISRKGKGMFVTKTIAIEVNKRYLEVIGRPPPRWRFDT
jgi:hypothetical protein